MAINRRDWLKHTGLLAFTTPLIGVGGRFTTVRAKPKVKIGQIGTKHGHARSKVRTMRKYPDVFEVIGIVEPDEDQRRQLESDETYQGLEWMTEEQLLSTPGLRAVTVETEVRELVPTAARCVAAGKHIHLDKPAGESLSAFRQVLEEAQRQELTVQMGYMFRYYPAFVFLFKALREGWLGQIFEAHGVMSKKISSEARLDLATYRGGTMFNEGCHLIDALVIALGEPENIEPYARCTRPELDTAVDNQVAVFEYPKAIATIRSAVVEADDGRHRRRQFVVCGEEGTIEIRPLQPSRVLLTLERPRGEFEKCTEHEVPLPALVGPYDDLLLDFASVVIGEREAALPPSHDLKVHECVLRASGLQPT